VVVLVPEAYNLFLAEGRRGPTFGPELVRPCFPHGLEPIRITAGPIVLWRSDDGNCAIAQPDGTVLVETSNATDVDVLPDGTIVIAGEPGEPFLRFAGADRTPLEPLGAPDYDGGAISVDPRGRVAYTTADGIRWTIGSVAKHVTEGVVVVPRMDSRVDRTRWGRVFFSACLPKGTSLLVRFATTEDVTTEPYFDGERFGVYRRPADPETSCTAEDFAAYEAPVNAPRGRYLWLEVTLRGTQRVTPRVRAIRVERPGHSLLDSLPRAFSRDEGDAEFLYRMLAPAEGMLHDLDRRAARRATLLDPAMVPVDQMAWLASLVGLVLDPRWPESARRTLITEAYSLFQQRGTARALRRMAEIFLGHPPQIIERWQLRGIGGTVLGTTRDGAKNPNIGASVRETGTLGRFTVDGTVLQPTSFATAAHKFTMLVPGNLTDEQRAVLNGLLETQAPAHTCGVIQELGAGMRIGTVRAGLTSFVGRAAEWSQARIGQVRLGGNGVLGTPAVGSQLGKDSVAGRVLVG
jgi:phage tail-like protein